MYERLHIFHSETYWATAFGFHGKLHLQGECLLQVLTGLRNCAQEVRNINLVELRRIISTRENNGYNSTEESKMVAIRRFTKPQGKSIA